MPRVSVIIPTFNRASMIQEAIESVLAQTYHDFEIIVVDDGSTDDTRQIIEAIHDERIHYCFQPNQGCAVARNNAAALSQGQYLVFLDSDDILSANALAFLAAQLDRRPDVGLVAGGFRHVNVKRRVLREIRPWAHHPSITLESLLFYGLTPPSAVMIRRDWFERAGRFDPKFGGAEDLDFWYRLMLVGCRMIWKQSIVCEYRIHDSNITNNINQNCAVVFAVLDDLFARPDLPAEITRRKQEIYTRWRLVEIGRLFAMDQMEDARALLKAALLLDPMLAQNHKRLTNAIVDWQKSVEVKDPARFLERVFESLPPEIASGKFRESVLASCRKSTFYDAYVQHRYNIVQKSWIEIVKREPMWLFNRGGWSILLQSIGIKARRALDDLPIDAS